LPYFASRYVELATVVSIDMNKALAVSSIVAVEVLHHRRPASVIQHESPVRNVRPNSAFQNNTELLLTKFVLDEASAGDALYAAAEHEMPVIFCRGNVCRVVPLEKRKEAYFTTGVS